MTKNPEPQWSGIFYCVVLKLLSYDLILESTLDILVALN